MKRKTKNLLYFLVIFTSFVALQLAFSLYTNFFSGRFVSPTLHKLEGLERKQELENLKAQTTTTTTTTTSSLKTTTVPLQHRTTLITNRTCAQHYTLLILVSSSPGNLQKRNNIRNTWAFESAFQPRWTTVFLIAQTRIQSESNSLLKEDEMYRDLVRADYYDHYWNQTLKIQMGFEWAIRYCKFSFLLKVDDDVFVNSAGLIHFLSNSNTPKKKLYMGIHYTNPLVYRGGKWAVTQEEYNGTHYPDFCPGFGYVLSHDAADLFVEAFSFVPHFRLDDVYVGMLANKTGIKIMHNDGFELDAPGRQCVPNQGTLVRHGFYEYSFNQDCYFEIYKRATKMLKTGMVLRNTMRGWQLLY